MWMSDARKIGELNGPWSVLARLSWALTPILTIVLGGVIALNTWTVNQLGDHHTSIAVLNEWKGQRVVALDAIAKRVDCLEAETRALQLAVLKNRGDVETALQGVNAKLETIEKLIRAITGGHIQKNNLGGDALWGR